MILTRRHGFRILDRRRHGYGLLDGEPDSARSSDDLLTRDYMISNDTADGLSVDSMTTMKHPPKKRRCCGATICTPNTSHFADHFHSRILQKFPFLIEMYVYSQSYPTFRTLLSCEYRFPKHPVGINSPSLIELFCHPFIPSK
jgi:hypothetical protein